MTLESATVPVTLECAGNNRNFLEPKVKGVQWRLGAVGTAVDADRRRCHRARAVARLLSFRDLLGRQCGRHVPEPSLD